jgi:hypothetical protein
MRWLIGWVHLIRQKFSKFAHVVMEFHVWSKTNLASSYVLVLRMHCGHLATVIALQPVAMPECPLAERVICSVVVLPA